MAAANQLVERGGDEAVAAVRKIMTPGEPARRRVHGLWVLNRRDALDDATLLAWAGDADRELRVHSLQDLVDRAKLASAISELAMSRLEDTDPFVRRAAAEVLGASDAREDPASARAAPVDCRR